MRTRNLDTSKSPAAKRTTPGRKPAAKTTPELVDDAMTPKSAEIKRGAAAKTKTTKNNEATTSPVTVSDSKPEASTDATPSTDPTPETVETKGVPRAKKVVRKVVKVVKKTGKAKTPTSKVLSEQLPEIAINDKDDESTKKELLDINVSDSSHREESIENLGESTKKETTTLKVEEPAAENVVDSGNSGKIVVKVEEPVAENVVDSGNNGKNVVKEEDPAVGVTKEEQCTVVIYGESSGKQQTAMEVDVPSNNIDKSYTTEESGGTANKEEVENGLEKVETKNTNEKEEPRTENVSLGLNNNEQLQKEDAQPEQGDYGGEEGYEEYADRVDFEDHVDDDFIEEDPDEPTDCAEVLEEEHRELNAVAAERKIKKEYEIFVGGLDRDATEEDLKRVFEKIGEVVEVRLHMNLSTNKNKGYAFVKFAKREHAKRALSEMKNPVIRGKRCGTAPSEDNDTLFVGNICNTWTKEAIRQKLKDYGVEGVQNITLVPDAQHEGRSRGFAFLEFSCHVDALLAYKRLQKPDVVFGHPERTVKVAFAEPIQEPDPEIMAQVKTVFLDGLLPHWDEDIIRENLRVYGEILRIVLARNMSTAKRKDFGFVDFSTHEAAVACIEGINNSGLGDGHSKARVRARLSNPLPKTQVVKGAMCGGFKIGHAGSGSFSRYGNPQFQRGGRHGNWSNFNRGRGFYQRERGSSNRMGLNEHFNDRYAGIQERPITGRGGRRGYHQAGSLRGGYHQAGSLRGGYHQAGREFASPGLSRSDFNRPWQGASPRGYGDYVSSRRQPFSPEVFDRPFVGRQFDDPYFYDDGGRGHGMKRPFYMTDHDPDYAEPSRLRPRLDYVDPADSYHGTRYRDSYGPENDPYQHDYYGPDYGAYPPSHYGSNRPYGGGYFY